MSSTDKMRLALLVALPAALLLAGCGTPGAPQPPSLNLPETVKDLAATRAGNQVSLTWTMPKRTTDKLLLNDKTALPVRICRKEATGSCEPVGVEVAFAPGAEGSFTETLPAALTTGSPRTCSYFVELRNRSGRSAGLSNAAPVQAGEAPAPVTGLTAEVRKQGVILRWANSSSPIPNTVIRLHRELLTPAPARSHEELLAPQPEPVDQNLLVESCVPEAAAGLCRTIDKSIHFGETYVYRAQRVDRVIVDGKTIELAGELSTPVRVEALDVFPPEVPTALAAVATSGENGASPAIDLSWQPVTDTDLAGYAVYRREADAAWQRISSPGPLVAPAFHDATVELGHTYHYAVSSIDQGGHESARSAETEETVPNP